MKKHNLESILILVLLCSTFLTLIDLARTKQAGASIVLSFQGTISDGGIPDGLLLKYRTDFEDIMKVDDHHLSLPISHWFEYRSDGADFWMEGLDRNLAITPHSGTRCLGMEITAPPPSETPRNEFNILPLNSLVGDELFVSVWLYLPADWGLFDPSWNWYELVCPQISPYSSNYYPGWTVHIVRDPDYRIDVDMRSTDLVQHTMEQTPSGSVVRDPPAYPLPKGRWFNVKYYVKRGSALTSPDGIMRIWIDDRIVCDLSNVITGGGQDWGTTPADIYGSLVQSAMPYRIWVDDLSIYGVS